MTINLSDLPADMQAEIAREYGPLPTNDAPHHHAYEDQEMIRLFKWVRANEVEHPELSRVYHNPNGGKRDKAAAGKIKAMGGRAGLWDVACDTTIQGYRGFRGEMKWGDGRLSDTQRQWLPYFVDQAFFVAVAWCWQDMAEALCEYMNLPTQVIATIGPKPPCKPAQWLHARG